MEITDELVREFIAKHGFIAALEWEKFKASKLPFEVLECRRLPYHTEWSPACVRRKLDGKKFSIGDSIYYPGQNMFGSDQDTCRIEYFTIHENDIYVNSHHVSDKECGISTWKKVTSLLFTTEDHVPVYEGDQYWAVDYYFVKHSFIADTADSSLFKRFSTEPAADEYILWNKPCLCLNDLISISSGTPQYCYVHRENIIARAKRKLTQ